jgi:Transposase DDE domain
VAIDSSKFKAVNSRDRNFTPNKVEQRVRQIEQSIDRYLTALETADRTQPAEVEAKSERLREKIETLRGQMRRMERIGEELKTAPGEQISETDPDARSMISQAKGSGVVGYNVQTAVDTKHHLIVTHEVTNVGNDRAQLTKMATAARDEMGKTKMQAVADRGYFNSNEIKACTEAGITPLVPKPMTSNARAEGRFSKLDFIYIARDDEYQCPAGERAVFRFATIENGLTIRKYWSSACPRCPLKTQCTTSSYRRITRWEHERILEAMQRRLDRRPDAMTLRRRTIEHVFGTLKHWMGSTHFLTRGLKHVGTEMALQVLAYNFKRLISLLGMKETMKAMRLMAA